jgi:hypothetical protein
MSSYNTNLAAEFHVLSTLYRLGADANLTLGNKKSVDIAVILDAGDSLTIDVKGLAGTTGWPIDNLKTGTPRHFVVFVCYHGKIGDPMVAPLCWVVPSNDVAKLTYNAPGGRKLMRVSALKATGDKYLNAWHSVLRDNKAPFLGASLAEL